MSPQIKIIKSKISSVKLNTFLGQPFEGMIKFVVDMEKGIIALGGELHADAEQILLQAGSKQQDLWGGNIYPERDRKTRLEYISLINIRPSQNNYGLEISDDKIKAKIDKIVNSLIE